MIYPVNYASNRVNNRKYSLLSFIPLLLINMFKDFINLYFLLIMITTLLVDRTSKGFAGSVAAVAFLIFFELIKEITEDVMRALSDRKINEQEYT